MPNLALLHLPRRHRGNTRRAITRPLRPNSFLVRRVTNTTRVCFPVMSGDNLKTRGRQLECILFAVIPMISVSTCLPCPADYTCPTTTYAFQLLTAFQALEASCCVHITRQYASLPWDSRQKTAVHGTERCALLVGVRVY